MLLDAAILVLHLVALTAFGLWIGRKAARSKEGYFLGGRRFTWVLIGFSLFATNVTSNQFMGVPGLAHKVGVAASNNDLVGALMLALSAICFIPLCLRARLFTIPEFLERRFSRTAKLIFGCTFVVQATLAMPAGFYAGGLGFLSLLNLDSSYLAPACWVIGLAIGLYAIVGGLASVVYTDVIQASLLVGGALLVTIIGLDRVGGPAALYREMGDTHFRLLLPADNPEMPWTAVVTGVALHSALFALCSVSVLQRALGASDVRHAQLGMLFGGALKLSTVFVLAVPGIIAAKLHPDISPDSSMAVLIRDLLPVGISGLVLAGLMSAVMSSADASVVAIGSVVALDIYPSCVRHCDEARAVRVGRISAVAVIVFGVMTAPFVAELGQVYPLLLRITSFMQLPVGTCFLLGRFVRRVNNAGTVTTLVVGLVTGVAYVACTTHPALKPLVPAWLVGAHFYHVVPVMFLVYAAILLGVSLLTAPPPAEKLAVLDAPADPSADGLARRPWWQGFNFWFGVFLAALAAIYAAF